MCVCVCSVVFKRYFQQKVVELNGFYCTLRIICSSSEWKNNAAQWRQHKIGISTDIYVYRVLFSLSLSLEFRSHMVSSLACTCGMRIVCCLYNLHSTQCTLYTHMTINSIQHGEVRRIFCFFLKWKRSSRIAMLWLEAMCARASHACLCMWWVFMTP